MSTNSPADTVSLKQALQQRKSCREFTAQTLSEELLLEMLWAGFGVNRPDGKHTAPSARDQQETDIYVCTQDGLFLYDAPKNNLKKLSDADIRADTGFQDFAATVPVDLVYVADLAKLVTSPEDKKALFGAMSAGFMSQNIALFCAACGLGQVVRASLDADILAKKMQLRPSQMITLVQSIGYPAA